MRKEDINVLDDKTRECLQDFRISKILLKSTQKVLTIKEKSINDYTRIENFRSLKSSLRVKKQEPNVRLYLYSSISERIYIQNV